MLDIEIFSLIRQIEEKTGIDIRNKCRKRPNFYAKVLFYTIVKESKPSITLSKLGSFVNRDHSSVIYAISCYNHLKKYPDFTTIELDIRSLKYDKSDKMIFCNPIHYPND